MKSYALLVALSVLSAGFAGASHLAYSNPPASSSEAASSAADAGNVPLFTADGKLAFPQKYREWIFLSAGIDMSYSEKPELQMHSMFDNVFVDPAAWKAFQESGRWPDKTELVMEVRGAESKGSINRRGHFQNEQVMGIEVHVKDTSRFKEGWAFFAFDSREPAAQIPVSASCYSCHQQHAAVDTTFVQFYPTLLPVAREKGSLSADIQH